MPPLFIRICMAGDLTPRAAVPGTLRIMSQRGREWVVLISLMSVALCVFLAGIDWGLPSRQRDDRFLFDDHPVWSGEQIASLAGERSNDRIGADVDQNPIARGSEPVILNGTD